MEFVLLSRLLRRIVRASFLWLVVTMLAWPQSAVGQLFSGRPNSPASGAAGRPTRSETTDQSAGQSENRARSTPAEAASPQSANLRQQIPLNELAPGRLSASEPVNTSTLLGVLRSGGPLLLPILFCSFILFVFGLERTISLRRGRVIPRPFVRRVVHQIRDGQLDADEALTLCEEDGSPMAQVLSAAVKKWNRPAVEVEQAILDAGERVTNQLRRYLRLFNGIYTISPLLGLLGTVVGMIRAFNTVATQDGMGRAELLAGGISTALITTAAGLTVAIPAVIAYLYFVGRVDSLVMEIDDLGQQVVDAVAIDGFKEKRTSGSKRRGKAA